ncbi:hypothetical protein NQ317_011781 [Molorchus minor]|uniref:Uncharacterized protein n=1 Tax=Molorchus minor TaxID=1323400 RepID=A0ABQ9JI53_9CUCU|nr:hypothetical protein NQ317_011781 [Molorchus minor]
MQSNTPLKFQPLLYKIPTNSFHIQRNPHSTLTQIEREMNVDSINVILIVYDVFVSITVQLINICTGKKTMEATNTITSAWLQSGYVLLVLYFICPCFLRSLKKIRFHEPEISIEDKQHCVSQFIKSAYNALVIVINNVIIVCGHAAASKKVFSFSKCWTVSQIDAHHWDLGNGKSHKVGMQQDEPILAFTKIMFI